MKLKLNKCVCIRIGGGKALDSLQILTSIYGLGLGCRLWSIKEVIQWCDKMIEASDNPPYEIIEVSLMSKAKINDIEGKLFELSRNADEEYAVKLILSVINEKLKRNQLTTEETIKCATRLLIQTELYWENEYFDLYSSDDSYDLAKDGVLDLSDIVDTYYEENTKISIILNNSYRDI